MPVREQGGYVRPTQGIRPRTGGRMPVNLENIGGRILFMEEMSGHKNRMREIKPVINVKPPWGHTEIPTKKPKKPGKKSRRVSTAPAADRGGYEEEYVGDAAMTAAPVAPPPSRGGSRPSGGKIARDFDLEVLSEDRQQLYHDFVHMLMGLGRSDSKALLERAYRESEEKKLLSGYTGIFPSLGDDGDEEEGSDDDASAAPSRREGSTAAAESSHHHNTHAPSSTTKSRTTRSESAMSESAATTTTAVSGSTQATTQRTATATSNSSSTSSSSSGSSSAS